MQAMKLFRWSIVTVLALVALLVGASAAVVLLGITINLDAIKGKIESAASTAIGRNVTLEGSLEIVPSLWPMVEVQGIRVANPPDWGEGDLLHAKLVRGQLELLPLLERKVLIKEITAKGVALMLETNADGKENWRFEDAKSAVPEEAAEETPSTPTDSEPTPGSAASKEVQQIEFLGLEELSLRNLAVTYRESDAERVLEFELEELAGEASADQPMQLNARGSFQNVPYSVAFTGGSIVKLLTTEEPWPIDLTTTGAGAQLSLKGSVAGEADTRGSTLELKLSGDRIGELAPWLGVSPQATSTYLISGQLEVTPDEWHLTPMEFQIGRTKLTGELAQTGLNSNPLTIAKFQFDAIDPIELEAILPPEQEAKAKPQAVEKPKEKKAGLTLDAPILPQQVVIDDADIEFGIKRIHMPTIDIRDVTLSSRFRDGKVERSPFQAVIAEALFKGDFDVDLRGEEPKINFNLQTNRIDIGDFLRRLKIAEDLELKADRLKVRLAARGRRIQGIVEKSDFSASVQNGIYTLRDPNTKASVDIQLSKGIARSSAGRPFTVNLEGRLDKTPVKIDIETERLATFLTPPDQVPLSFKMEAAGTQVKLTGAAAVPLSRNLLGFKLTVQGENLSSLDELLEVSLPPLGPYSLAGQFSVSENGYKISDLDVRVRDSDLIGNLSLETKGERPRLDVDLTTNRLQINDFDVGDWSPVEDEAESAPTTEQTTSASSKKTAGKEEEPYKDLLSPEVLGSLNGRLSVKVKEVLSGTDQLGSGSLLVSLENARFAIEPLILHIPGGSVELALAYAPTETDVTGEARAHIDRFDYGVLARRIKPETDMAGLLSLDMDLKSRADNLDVIMHHVNGHLDFAVWPENIESGVFDLWAVNLMTAVLPEVDSAKKSKVNCAVGRLNLKDGRMTDDKILIDTTNMRVKGEGRADFKSEKVKLDLTPRAKTPQFFSLATPIKVKGKFSDFGVGVKKGALVGTAIRFVTSPVHVPLRMIAEKKLPADGGSACAEAMKRKNKKQ